MRWDDRIGRRIKLSDLHVLLGVAQSGSMAKAARQLAVSQPVISRSISTLEHTLGVRLLERSSRGVKLTPYGRAMLSRSNAAFDELRQGVKDIAFLTDPGVGEVRIGATNPLAASFVSTIIDRLYRRYPRLVFHVVTNSADALLRDLEERSLDLLVLRQIGTVDADVMNFEALYDNPYFVAAGVQNPLTRRRRIELAELLDEPWILPPADTRFGLLATQTFNARGLAHPRAAVIATSIELINTLLRTGHYIAIHPESVFTFPTKHPFIRRLKVDLPVVSGPIGLMTVQSRMLSPAAELFIASARELARQLGRKKS